MTQATMQKKKKVEILTQNFIKKYHRALKNMSKK